MDGYVMKAPPCNNEKEDGSSDSDYIEESNTLELSSESDININDEGQNDQGDEYLTENTKVIQLVNYSCCAKRCIFGRTREMDLFINSLDEMTKEMQHACILTSLSISISLMKKRKSRSKGLRARYTYVMPYLGTVCKQAFEASFDISGGSLNRLRKQVSLSILPKKHGNISNKNAKSVDYDTLREWFHPYALSIGQTVQARRKTRRKTQDGQIQIKYRTDHIIVIPSSFTYEKLHQDYLTYLNGKGMEGRCLPSEKTFRDYIKKSFPDIRLESQPKHKPKKSSHATI